MLNSIRFAIHLALLPSTCGYVRTSFNEAEGTYAITLECKMYIQKDFKDLIRE